MFLAKPQRSPGAGSSPWITAGPGVCPGSSSSRLDATVPSYRDPSCLLALGHSTPGRRARRGMMFPTTAEANQQLARQPSKKTDQHKKGTVFCQLSPALSTCSSTGREDGRSSRSGSGPQPCLLRFERLPGRGLHNHPPAAGPGPPSQRGVLQKVEKW